MPKCRVLPSFGPQSFLEPLLNQTSFDSSQPLLMSQNWLARSTASFSSIFNSFHLCPLRHVFSCLSRYKIIAQPVHDPRASPSDRTFHRLNLSSFIESATPLRRIISQRTRAGYQHAALSTSLLELPARPHHSSTENSDYSPSVDSTRSTITCYARARRCRK